MNIHEMKFLWEKDNEQTPNIPPFLHIHPFLSLSFSFFFNIDRKIFVKICFLRTINFSPNSIKNI